MARAKVDFRVVSHGTIYLLYPNTCRARHWVMHNLPHDHLTYADASVIEHRYIGDMIEGIQRDELDITVSLAPLPS